MVSILKVLSDDEATVVLAAFEGMAYQALSYVRGGSFGQFARLPGDIRNQINWHIGEYGGQIEEYRMYTELPDKHSGAQAAKYLIARTASKRWISISPLLDPPSPHITQLAKKVTEPWSFVREIRKMGIKGVIAYGVLTGFGSSVYFQEHERVGLLVLGLVVGLLSWSFIGSPILYYRRATKVTKALLAIEEKKNPSSTSPSMEDLIRIRGGTLGPPAAQGGTAG